MDSLDGDFVTSMNQYDDRIYVLHELAPSYKLASIDEALLQENYGGSCFDKWCMCNLKNIRNGSMYRLSSQHMIYNQPRTP